MKTILNFSRKEQLILLACLFLKLLVVYSIYSQEQSKLSFLALAGNGYDSMSYIEPATVTLQKLDLCRLPGYPLLIRVFYRAFGEGLFLDFLVIFQVLLNIISSFFIFKIGEHLINRRVGFAAGVTFLFLPIINFYDLSILTENGNCFFIFAAFYLLIVPVKMNKYLRYFIIGSLICATFTFRPVSLLVIPFIGLISLYKFNFASALKLGLVALIPFLIFESFWIPFNYKRFKEIIPIAKSHQYVQFEENFHFYASDLWGSFGGKADKPNYLDEPQVGSFSLQFYPFKELKVKLPHKISDAYTSKFNADAIEKLKIDIGDCDYCFSSDFAENMTPEEVKVEVDKRNVLINTVTEMRASVIKEHPFIFLFSKVIPVGLFFSQAVGVDNQYIDLWGAFSKETWLQRAFIILWNVSTALMLSFGLLGLILLVFGKNRIAGLFALSGLAFLFVYCLFFGMPEWRYITGAVPFLLLGLYYFISRTLTLVKGKIKTN